nr:hypothetical protein [uncultured Noviherbaspirillum sp.]
MNEPSALFLELERRIGELTEKFVSDQVAAEAADIANFVPDLDRLAAYRLLSHAEIEDYLERKAKERLNVLEVSFSAQNWSVSKDLSIYVLAALVSESLPFESPHNERKFLESAKLVIKAAKELIDNNNGVKSGSFMKLSVISGKMVDEIDSSLASSLSSFGANRGDVAHKGVRRTNTIQAPSTEMKSTLDLVKHLKMYFYEDAV